MLYTGYWIVLRNPSVPSPSTGHWLWESLFILRVCYTSGRRVPTSAHKFESNSTWHTRLPRPTSTSLTFSHFSPPFMRPLILDFFFFSRPARSVPGLLLKGHTRGPVVSGFAGLIGSRQTGLKPHWGRCLSAGQKSKNQSRPAAQSRQSAAWRAAIDGCQASRASRSQQRYFPTLARVQ